MTFENPMESTSNSRSHINELFKKTLELEAKNIDVENMAEGEDRDTEIAPMDKLNMELDRLEKVTELPDEAIIKEYENLTKEAAIQGIGNLLKELEASTDIETIQGLKDELNTSNFDNFLATIKSYIPNKLLLATACALLLSTPAMSAEVPTPEISDVPTVETQNIQKSHDSSLERTNQIITTANQRAFTTIQNIDGFIKKLAQKKVMDELANHSQEIIQYINDDKSSAPQLNSDASELFTIYRDAIVEVDELQNKAASIKIRQNITKKINLISTKDYDKIQEDMSQG